jgi:hypothetical protein
LHFLSSACYELRYHGNFAALGDDLRVDVFNVTWPAVAGVNSSGGADLELRLPSQDTIELLLDERDQRPPRLRALVKINLRAAGGGSPYAYFPCKLFWHGGRYLLRYNNGSNVAPLDVKWYNVTLVNVTNHLIHVSFAVLILMYQNLVRKLPEKSLVLLHCRNFLNEKVKRLSILCIT